VIGIVNRQLLSVEEATNLVFSVAP
jgi:hypothetical protein